MAPQGSGSSDVPGADAPSADARERIRALFETTLIGFALHDIVLDDAGSPVDYVFLEANEAFGEYTGLVSADILGRRVTEVIPGVEESGLIALYGRVALGGEPQRFETYFEPLDRHFDINVFSPQPGQFATAFLDITERVRAQQTLRAFFDNRRVGLGILDRDLRYVRVNEVLSDINQVAVADHLGRTAEDVLGEDSGRSIPALRRVLGGEEEVSLELSRAASSETGAARYWLKSYFPIAEENGTVEAIGLVAIDVTARREAERELAETNADLERRVLERTLELEAAIDELEAFSYSVSHDLRSPLRALDGFSLALLEDYGDVLDDTGKDYLHRVRAGSQRMGALIDDLLVLSRMSRREMRREKVDLAASAREVIADLRREEPERDVEFTLPETLDADGDPGLLRALLQNLLGNAWKFTSRRPTAHVELGVDRRGDAVTYFVRDDGVGFEPAYVDKLFTPFQRLHTAKEFPGTGIGLATVQRIVRRHGGRAWAEGVVDGGATVYFTLGVKGEH
jgi:PAS domain S-box-containing protein